MSADLTPQIQTNALAPEQVETDKLKVKQIPIGDQIKADRYLKACQAGSMLGLGLRMRRLQHPPQVPDVGTADNTDTFNDNGSFS